MMHFVRLVAELLARQWKCQDLGWAEAVMKLHFRFVTALLSHHATSPRISLSPSQLYSWLSLTSTQSLIVPSAQWDCRVSGTPSFWKTHLDRLGPWGASAFDPALQGHFRVFVDPCSNDRSQS